MEKPLTHENKKALCQLMTDENLCRIYDLLSDEEKLFILDKAQNDYRYHGVLFDLNRCDLFTYKSLYGFMANKKIHYGSKITAIRDNHCRSLITPELSLIYFKNKDHFTYFRNEEDDFCLFILQYFDGMNVDYDLLQKDKLNYILENHPQKDEILFFLLKNNTIINHLTISSYTMLLDVIEKSKMVSNKIGNFTINSSFLINCFSDFDEEQKHSLIRFLVRNDQINKIEEMLKELTCKNSLNNNLRGIKRKLLNQLILNLKKAIKEVNHKPNYITIFLSDEPQNVLDAKIKYYLMDQQFDRLNLMNFWAIYLSKNNEYLFSWLYQLHCYSVIKKFKDDEVAIVNHISSDLASRLNDNIWISLINRDYRFWAITPRHFRNKIRKHVNLKANSIFQQKRFFGIKEEDVDENLIFELCEVEISNILLYTKDLFFKNKDKLKEIKKNIYSNHYNVEYNNEDRNECEMTTKISQIMNSDEIYEYCLKKRINFGYFRDKISNFEELAEQYQYDILEEVYTFHFEGSNFASKRLENPKFIKDEAYNPIFTKSKVKDKRLAKDRYELFSLGELISSFDIAILNDFFKSKSSIYESQAQIWYKMVVKHPRLLIVFPKDQILECLKQTNSLYEIVSMYISRYQQCEFIWSHCNFYERRNLILRNLYIVLDHQVFGSLKLQEFESYFINEGCLGELLSFLSDPIWTPEFLNRAYTYCLEKELNDEKMAIEQNPLFNSVDMAIYLMEQENE